MTARTIVLKIHLWLALVAAVFLAILGLTGSIMAFENDMDRWLHPRRWYGQTGPQVLPEGELIEMIQQRLAPARVGADQIFRHPELAHVMEMTNGQAVFVNPYDGRILDQVIGPTPLQKAIGYIHQVHLRLVPDPRSAPRLGQAGKVVISFAGLILCLLVPTGVILWWRTRRASIQRKASWFRMCFDAHHAIGIYAALFLWIAAFTGILIGFEFAERSIYALTHSAPPSRQPLPHSEVIPGAAPIRIDQALEIARGAMPGATVAGLFLPLGPKAAFHVMMRVPEETSETVHSGVSIDQYSGRILQVRNFLTDSMGYRVIRFNRSIHTGDIWGLPSHILVSLSSLLLVAMVITGLVIWWKKLAV